LALTSGATDAIGFISLGGAFTSVMTGNMILLGIAVPNGDGGLALRSGLAIVLFMAGSFVGARIAGAARPDDEVWPAPVTRALIVELVIFVALAVVWWIQGGHPTGRIQPVLLGAAAVALGVQSSAILRFGVSGLSTTYMTGTLTTVVSLLAQGRHPRKVFPSVQILISLTIGAVLAALLIRLAPAATPLLQLIPVAVAIIGAWLGLHGPVMPRTR
jgi:uncharacterized membrane protein YoaK (UPF0700 family)